MKELNISGTESNKQVFDKMNETRINSYKNMANTVLDTVGKKGIVDNQSRQYVNIGEIEGMCKRIINYDSKQTDEKSLKELEAAMKFIKGYVEYVRDDIAVTKDRIEEYQDTIRFRQEELEKIEKTQTEIGTEEAKIEKNKQELEELKQEKIEVKIEDIPSDRKEKILNTPLDANEKREYFLGSYSNKEKLSFMYEAIKNTIEDNYSLMMAGKEEVSKLKAWYDSLLPEEKNMIEDIINEEIYKGDIKFNPKTDDFNQLPLEVKKNSYIIFKLYKRADFFNENYKSIKDKFDNLNDDEKKHLGFQVTRKEYLAFKAKSKFDYAFSYDDLTPKEKALVDDYLNEIESKIDKEAEKRAKLEAKDKIKEEAEEKAKGRYGIKETFPFKRVRDFLFKIFHNGQTREQMMLNQVQKYLDYSQYSTVDKETAKRKDSKLKEVRQEYVEKKIEEINRAKEEAAVNKEYNNYILNVENDYQTTLHNEKIKSERDGLTEREIQNSDRKKELDKSANISETLNTGIIQQLAFKEAYKKQSGYTAEDIEKSSNKLSDLAYDIEVRSKDDNGKADKEKKIKKVLAEHDER